MFTHLLVPLDGSALAEAILPTAKFFAVQLPARVTLLHVVEPAPPSTIHGDIHLMNAAAAEEYLTRIAREFQDAGVEVSWHVDVAAGGDVAHAIFAHGGELAADLIMLTDHGRSGLREVLVGSIAQQVLQSGQIPVLLVKAQHAEMQHPFKSEKILVPLDGSALYEPALDVARDLARCFNSILQLVVVVPTANTLSPERAATGILLPHSTQAVLDLAQAGAVEYLQKKVEALAKEGLHSEASVERGDVPAKIVEAEERGGADLLVIATHGRAGLDAFWSGSVAPQVLTRARVPVLLLRVKGEEPVR